MKKWKLSNGKDRNKSEYKSSDATAKRVAVARVEAGNT